MSDWKLGLLLTIAFIAILALILWPVAAHWNDPARPIYPTLKDGWEFVTTNPSGGPLYKRHIDSEHATFYASPIGGSWSISVVKD